MNQATRGIIALLVSIIGVHAFYEVVVRPNARMIEQMIIAGNAEMQRSIWIIMKDFEQEACLILMLWAIYLIVEKILEITKTNYLFDVDFMKDTEMSKDGLKESINDLDSLASPLDKAPLIKVMKSSMRRFLVSNDIHSMSEVVESEINALAAKNEAGNSMIRYLIWAVPSIGFIGTVRGIGEALSKADQALAGDISGMTSSLGVAFNSTLVALFISIILMFLLHQLQKIQDDLAVSVNSYLQEKVLDRLSSAQMQ